MFVHVRITGRVQGVCYRAWTMDEARSLGLSGWVRNCSDGAVEAVFEGDDELVKRMIQMCNDGPPLARVTGVAVTPRETSCGADGFEIIH